MISFVLVTYYTGNASSRETVYHEPLPVLKARLTKSFASHPTVLRYKIQTPDGAWLGRGRNDRKWLVNGGTT